MIHIDFETYSEADLSNGVHVYAEHPSTEVLCLAWDGGLWVPGKPIPQELLTRLQNEQLAAWHAQFERTIWNNVLVPKYGFPEVALERWACTQAKALSLGLPARLDKSAEFLGLYERKDAAGHTLMLKISKPNKKGERRVPTPEETQRLIDYCIQDVVVERTISQRLGMLDHREQAVWRMDQRINDRGIPVDVRFAEQAEMMWESYLERLNCKVGDITKGIKGTQVGALTRWVKDRYPACKSLGKANVLDLLRRDDLPFEVSEVLKLRLEIGSTAVKKYKKICACAGTDNRIRGTLRYHKASTGRWAGALIQPQNLPKGILTEEELEEARSLVEQGDSSALKRRWGDVGDVLGSLCRQTIRTDKTLIAADYAQIEARCVAWLADQEDLLLAFRNDADPYTLMASKVFDKVGPKQRQIGKALVLGCGYQMGGIRFRNTLKTQYGVEVSEKEAAGYVKEYRAANPKIVHLWYRLEDAVAKAIIAGDREVPPLEFRERGDWLKIKLPSGRDLSYYSPKFEGKITFEGCDIGGNKLNEQLYGGKILENISQAICRDLLVEAMFRLEKAGHKIIATVHDEVLCEGNEGDLDGILEIMRIVPGWAMGFPIGAEGWEGKFFKKD